MTNHLRPSWILLALIISGVPCVGAFSAGSSPFMDYLQNPNPQRWPQYCAKIKAKLSQSQAAFLTFTPLPELPTNVAPVWKLNWHGLAIPVPTARYTKIALIANRSALSLGTEHHQSFTVVGSSSQDQKSHQSPARTKILKRTRDGYGGAVWSLTRPYTITPKDLSCSTKNVNQQTFDVLALQGKGLLPGLGHLFTVHKARLIAVHKVKRFQAGLLAYARTTSNDVIYLYEFHNGSNLPLTDVTYRLPGNRPDLFGAALLLTKPAAAVYTDPPFWFRRLQTWIEKPSQSHWCTLLSALNQAHFDPKSLQQLAKSHPACQAAQP